MVMVRLGASSLVGDPPAGNGNNDMVNVNRNFSIDAVNQGMQDLCMQLRSFFVSAYGFRLTRSFVKIGINYILVALVGVLKYVSYEKVWVVMIL